MKRKLCPHRILALFYDYHFKRQVLPCFSGDKCFHKKQSDLSEY